MGKELRVSIGVVGVVLLVFCVLLYQRLTRPEPKLPEASIPLPTNTIRSEPQPPAPSSAPTIVRERSWTALDPVQAEAERNPKHPDPTVIPPSDAGLLRQPDLLPAPPTPLTDPLPAPPRTTP
ncbi:MAG: hypothetical protein KatS3mg110_0911 [Pirellulaceae bacterium]|nr:MAG: hypothetical protein KatS3mg110_0911 [Pirellulaceae bacterium]